ncbi:DotD/TraH family lipoprotein [Roseomonas mucosa]|uniref:DotD/TraH family lipoprotein n=1 Tax=Roseomonas mucosa TaxID=207340 RepID=UPI00384B358D
MARMHSRLLPALIGLVGLAGCATTGGPGTEIATPGMPNPEVALRQSMEQVGRQLSQLGGVSLADLSARRGPVVPEELQRPIAFTWSGPLADGVRTLADVVGYRVVVSSVAGVERPQPVPVSVNLPTTTVVDAFAALGEQAGAYATVQLDPASRTVQVVHRV